MTRAEAKAIAERVVAEIARKHRVGVHHIICRGRQRTHSYVSARMEAYAAVHAALPWWTLHELGAFFQRDHSTICHCLRSTSKFAPRSDKPARRTTQLAAETRLEMMRRA
ncbi:MAG: hypothetical protein KGL39_40590 [Patescibacteria group bacterium]|nr:hypothetical protein [Patescibacteria group bacterium]